MSVSVVVSLLSVFKNFVWTGVKTVSHITYTVLAGT